MGNGVTVKNTASVSQRDVVDSLTKQLAKANERVKELEKRNNNQSKTIMSMEGCIAREVVKAFESVKDKWIKKASEMPQQLECRSKGSSCYNWAMFYARELTDEAEQLRKEQEGE